MSLLGDYCLYIMCNPEQRVNPLDLLSAEDVATLFGVRKSWVYQEAASGALPSIKLSHKVLRFSPVELQDWLAQRARGAGSNEHQAT